MTKYLSRRFVLTMGCGVVTTILCWFGKIDGNTYALVILGTVGAYITAGTVEKKAVLRAQAANP